MTGSPCLTEAATRWAAAVRDGSRSPVREIERVLARIEALNGATKAYISVDGAGARAAAEGGGLGPLAGVPYAAKDLFETRSLPTTGGSRVLEGWRSGRDAAAIERLSAAGAVLLGKANLHEFAHGTTGENARFGTPANPWDPTRMAGGSSSGSAVAVAQGLACFALGSDTGGSTRVPAALCGLIGFKPSFGRISREGMIPYCWSLDHVGIIAGSVGDTALVLQALAGHDPRDGGSADLPVPDYGQGRLRGVRGLRVGVPERHFFEHADPEILAATRRCLARLVERGAELRPVSLPDLSHARTVSLLLQMPEVLSYHRRYLPEKLGLYGEDVRSGLAFGQFILAEHYVRAQRMVEQYRRESEAAMADVDVVITPTCPVVAPALGTATVETEGLEEPVGNALTRFTAFFNMTGAPALSVPSGFHSTGLPMGVQIVGHPFDEATVLAVGQAIEEQQGSLFDPADDCRDGAAI
ncbi:MAG TPA: amidase [Hypericibacter adhaerens]|jgi:aspartyl-tRNA(Asn)/glutamyl-tRNA(Gln) amidotransferase subunit A|uniref:amidase n=1 Tax=Hypericibacter adhaerens TaxID=2602016 RepID=UPI002C651DF2|nr:amidase [Hypericibacter adhaerens]HWA43952.1 amidase [Hypericibacter adhaerens]